MELIVVLVLILCGFFVGRYLEKKSYTSIKAREDQYRQKPVISGKSGLKIDKVHQAHLAVGSVVVSIDRFKQVMSAIQNLIGGEVHAFSSLIDRGRREATLRMIESSPNADAYYNFKIETSTISTSANQNTVGTVEVYAYSTAIQYKK